MQDEMCEKTGARSGPQVVTFFSDIDDTEQPYGLYVPPRYDPQRAYPLVVMLHGGGSNHRLALRRVFGKSNLPGENDVEATLYFPEWGDLDYFVISPLARGSIGYQGIAEKDVYDALADVRERYNIDENRIYLTGLSMGGGGTLWLGFTRPDLWAALAPVCAGGPSHVRRLAQNAANLPIHIFHGDADSVVPVQGSRDLAATLTEMGAHVEYVEYEGVNHNSWENAYEDGAIFTIFANYERDPFPSRVRYVTDAYAYTKAYWVTIDELTPGTDASVDAAFTAANAINLSLSQTTGITLELAAHPQFDPTQPVHLTINGAEIPIQTAGVVHLRMSDGAWGVVDEAALRASSGRLTKKAGAEGPIREALSARHLYVYGTSGDPSEEELRARREQAIRAAASWSAYRPGGTPLLIFPRVVADKDVRQSDLEQAHLVLFGTQETNRLIDRFQIELPLHLDSFAATADYGLLYIFPVGGRYVLINSGQSWMDAGASIISRFGQRSVSLTNLGDFVLWRGSLENRLVEGRFNPNWELEEAAAAQLKGTGVVRL